MTLVKDAPRTSTSLIIRSDANTRITASQEPFYELMRRLFQNESSAIRGQRFVMLILEREASGNPIRAEEWRQLLDEFDKYGYQTEQKEGTTIATGPDIRLILRPKSKNQAGVCRIKFSLNDKPYERQEEVFSDNSRLVLNAGKTAEWYFSIK